MLQLFNKKYFLYKQNMTDPQVQIAELTANVQTLTQQIQGLKNEVATKQTQKQALRNQLTQKQNQLKTKTTQLQAKTAQLTQNTKQSSDKINQLNKINKDLTTELQNKKTDITKKQAQIKKQKQQIDSKTSEIEKITKNNTEQLKKMKEDHVKIIQDLKKDSANKNNELNQFFSSVMAQIFKYDQKLKLILSAKKVRQVQFSLKPSKFIDQNHSDLVKKMTQIVKTVAQLDQIKQLYEDQVKDQMRMLNESRIIIRKHTEERKFNSNELKLWSNVAFKLQGQKQSFTLKGDYSKLLKENLDDKQHLKKYEKKTMMLQSDLANTQLSIQTLTKSKQQLETKLTSSQMNLKKLQKQLETTFKAKEQHRSRVNLLKQVCEAVNTKFSGCLSRLQLELMTNEEIPEFDIDQNAKSLIDVCSFLTKQFQLISTSQKKKIKSKQKIIENLMSVFRKKPEVRNDYSTLQLWHLNTIIDQTMKLINAFEEQNKIQEDQQKAENQGLFKVNNEAIVYLKLFLSYFNQILYEFNSTKDGAEGRMKIIQQERSKHNQKMNEAEAIIKLKDRRIQKLQKQLQTYEMIRKFTLGLQMQTRKPQRFSNSQTGSTTNIKQEQKVESTANNIVKFRGMNV